MKRLNVNPLVLFVALVALAIAGTTNLDSLTLSDDLVVGDQATITGALSADDLTATDDVTAGDDLVVGDDANVGDKLFLDYGGTGTVAHIDISGTAGNSSSRLDMDSNGMELLLAASPASGASVSAVAVTSAAAAIKLPLTVTGNILPEADGTRTAGDADQRFLGMYLIPAAAPAQTASTAAGLLWLHDATANNGCDGACTNHKLYCFINGAWTALH